MRSLTRLHLELIDRHTQAIDELTARIEVLIEPVGALPDLICTIPGVSTGVADVVIAETGADMTRFPTAGHLASWAGTTPGRNESAGRVKSTKTRPGNPYLKGGWESQRCQPPGARTPTWTRSTGASPHGVGPSKAVALEHAMLIAIWNMAQPGRSTTTQAATSTPAVERHVG
jgi:hypothetical protein